MITYIQVENVSKSFGETLLFSNISFSVLKDQRTVLIAKNGTGKSTLLDILVQKGTPDKGIVVFKNDLRIGYLPQNPEINPDLTVIEQVFSSANDIINAIKLYEQALEQHNSNKLQDAINLMDTLHAWDYEARIKQILDKLQITDFNKKAGLLSGGQKKRVALANALIVEPDLLILDEPTNHLDAEMIEWLEEYLLKSNLTLLMVTHDRYFLDRVCTNIIEIDDNTVFNYSGNYSYYLEKRDERIRSTMLGIEKANNLMRTELEWMRRMPKARTGKAKYRIDNFYQLKEAASKRINTDKMEINVASRRLGSKIMEIFDIGKAFDNKVLISNFSHKFTPGEKIGIIGPNGIGKSTLLNILTGKLNPDSGTIETGTTVHLGYYTQSGISFDENKRVVEVVKEIAEVVTLGDGKSMSVVQFLDYFLFPPSMHYNLVAKLSGGERRRLYLMTILMQNPNFLILDEPTNDFDIMTLNVLEDYLNSFNGCVLVVSHDRYFLDKVVETLFVFNGEGVIRNFPGNYTVYKTYMDEKEMDSEPATKKSIEKIKAVPKKFPYKLQKEFEQIEIDINVLNTEKAQLEQKLSEGTVNNNQIIEFSGRISEILQLLENKEMRWLELSELKDEN